MAQTDLKHIPLDQLRISKLNMRHGRRKPDVSDAKANPMASLPDAAASLP